MSKFQQCLLSLVNLTLLWLVACTPDFTVVEIRPHNGSYEPTLTTSNRSETVIQVVLNKPIDESAAGADLRSYFYRDAMSVYEVLPSGGFGTRNLVSRNREVEAIEEQKVLLVTVELERNKTYEFRVEGLENHDYEEAPDFKARFSTSPNTCALFLEKEASVVAPPANVNVDFNIKDSCTGKPVPNIDSFKFYQDGQEISNFEAASGVSRKNRDYRSKTLLLIDLSGSVTNSGNLDVLKAAAKSFATTILAPERRTNYQVAIYGFAGDANISRISDFSNDPVALGRAIDAVTCPGPPHCADSTTDLYNAVINGVRTLDSRLVMDAQANPGLILGGTLVVYTDGTDRAERRQLSEAVTAVKGTKASVITVSIGSEINTNALSQIGKSGYFGGLDYAQLEAQFAKVVAEIQAEADSHYSAYFCSDKRNNATHILKVEAITENKVGSLEFLFNSTGFGGGCQVPTP